MESTPPPASAAADSVRAPTMPRDHPLRRLEVLVLIAVGGFAGSNLRYLGDVLLPGLSGTLAANALGSLALGFLLYEALHSGLLTNETRFVLATGFVSSFTTYSTFALETALAPTPGWMLANVVANYGLGLAGVLVGRQFALRVDGRSA